MEPATLTKNLSFYFGPGASSEHCVIERSPHEDDEPAEQPIFNVSNFLNSIVALQEILPPSTPLLVPTKFPSTEHLFDASTWLGGRGALDESDSMLRDPKTRKLFLGGAEVLVEEKLDGANLAVFFEPGSPLCDGHKLPKPSYKNRGKSVCSATSAQYKGLDAWMDARHRTLWAVLGWRDMLFGEWCFLVHTRPYTSLPDYFVAFDIWDRATGKYLSADRRNVMVVGTGIPTVPRLAAGKWDESALRQFIYGGGDGGDARLSLCNPEGVLEGIYLRVDGDDGFLKHRAKIVRHDFIQAIEPMGEAEAPNIEPSN